MKKPQFEKKKNSTDFTVKSVDKFCFSLDIKKKFGKNEPADFPPVQKVFIIPGPR